MSNGLRTTFWVHAFVALVIGIALVLAPVWTMDLLGWDLLEPPLMQLYGVTIIALGVSSLLAALAHRWEEVRVVAYTEVFFTAAAVLMFLYLMFISDAAIPGLTWALAILYALFFVAFGYFALQERAKTHAVEPPKPAYR
jgi:hypothetical protein